MAALIISILLSLNIISTPAEYERMSAEEKAQVEIVITDINF